MTTTTVPTRTITETRENEEGTNFLISCVTSMNDDGTNTPTIYASEVLEKPMKIDNTSGVEGELLISSEEGNTAVIQDGGELEINTSGDNADKYSVDETKGDLLYEE